MGPSADERGFESSSESNITNEPLLAGQVQLNICQRPRSEMPHNETHRQGPHHHVTVIIGFFIIIGAVKVEDGCEVLVPLPMRSSSSPTPLHSISSGGVEVAGGGGVDVGKVLLRHWLPPSTHLTPYQATFFSDIQKCFQSPILNHIHPMQDSKSF